MTDVLMVLFFVAIILAPLFIAVAVVSFLKHAARKYKNPLTHNLRRPPGGTLQRMLQGAYFNQMFPLVIFPVKQQTKACHKKKLAALLISLIRKRRTWSLAR